MADELSYRRHRRSRRGSPALGRYRQLQHRAEGRGRLLRRSRQQGRVPRDPRRLAQAAAQGRRGSVRRQVVRGDLARRSWTPVLRGDDVGSRRPSCTARSRSSPRSLPMSPGASSRPRPGRRPSASSSAAAFAKAGSARSRSRALSIMLKSEDFKVDLVPIRHHPDDAGLIGDAHLAPSWIFEAHEAFSPSTSAAPTSAAAWSSPTRKGRGSVQGRGVEIASCGAMPTTSRRARAR